ncbi:MAG: hypothetical protein P1V97_24640 [Planctomycetota bacterium]|nr:hypothetical protein [Planctomycetota bacterium]
MRTLRELGVLFALLLPLGACQSSDKVPDKGKRPELKSSNPTVRGRRPCVHCHQNIDGSYVVYNKKQFHKECYLRVAPRCGICQRSIFGSATTLGERYNYHTPCFSRSPRCDACSLPTEGSRGGVTKLSDGRKHCGECQGTAINTLNDARSLFSTALLELHRNLDIDLRSVPIELKLADRASMSKLADFKAPIVKGFTVAERKDVKIGGRFYQGPWKITIWVLKSLPREAVIGVMVHELFHVWQVQNCPTQSPPLREGSANYAQWRVLKKRQQMLWAALIEMDPDPVYGGGFRRFQSWLQKDEAWGAALAKLRQMKDLPASN